MHSAKKAKLLILIRHIYGGKVLTAISVTRFGDLLDFGQLFKALGNK